MNDLLSEQGVLAIWLTNKQKYHDFVTEHLLPYWNLELLGHWHWMKVSIFGI